MKLKSPNRRRDIPARVALPLVALAFLWLFSLGAIEHAAVWLWHLPQLLHHAGAHGPRPYPDDYIMFWAAGHISAGGAPGHVYVRHLFNAWEGGNAPGHVFGDPFIYPPITLLLTEPLAFLGYWPGFVLWISAIVASSMFILRRAGLPWPVIVAGLLSPAVLLGIIIGQISLLAGAFSLAALLCFETVPRRAGILAGLATIKPQDGLIIPFAMLGRGRYRPIAAGILTILMMGILVTLLFGPDIWLAYWRHGVRTAEALMRARAHSLATTGYQSGYMNFFVSVFWMLRQEHFPMTVSLVAQALAACCAIAIAVHTWRGPVVNPLARVALTVFLGSFLTPYAFTDDLAGYSFMLAALAWQRRRVEIADVFLFTWPGYSPFITETLHVSPSPLLIAYAAWRAWISMHKLPRRDLVPGNVHMPSVGGQNHVNLFVHNALVRQA